VQSLNRADHNAARHAEPPIRSHETEGGQRRERASREPTEPGPEDVIRPRPPASAPEARPGHRPQADRETRHEHNGGAVRTPDSPASHPADGRAAAGNLDPGARAVEGNSRTSEHHPDVRPVLTHFHAEFKGQSTDLYTDGTRWASGDPARRGDASAGRGEIPEHLPTGEDLVDTAGEEASRVEKLRRELYDEAGDLSDDIDRGANRLHDIFSPPPTNSYEATPVGGPHFSATQHPGMDLGAGAAALFALGLTIDRVARWGARHLEKNPERD
jgi:hypothetical protein